MNMRNTQPSLMIKSNPIIWANLDPYRLILAKYKHSDSVTTLMRQAGSGLFIVFGETKIEPVTNHDWLRQNLDFVRYYEPTDKLELSGS